MINYSNQIIFGTPIAKISWKAGPDSSDNFPDLKNSMQLDQITGCNELLATVRGQ